MLKLSRFFFDQAISIDNALTTNQIIHQIIKQVKEVVDYVNSLETDAHEYTDTKVLELKTQLEHQISELETFLKGYADTKLVDAKNYTDSEIANLRLNYIDVKISEIYETITALESRLDAKIDYTDAKLTNLIDSVKSELIELIKKGGVIYSGYTGLLTALQDEIHNIYDVYSKFFGLTWDVWSSVLSKASALMFSGTPGYSDNKITSVKGKRLFGAPYRYTYVENSDNTFNVSIYFPTYALPQIINGVKLNNVIVDSSNVTISSDRKTITVSNININALPSSMNRIDIGTITDDEWTNTNYTSYLSNFDANALTISFTWDTIDYLKTRSGAPITYDFVTYYFYTRFGDVFNSRVKTSDDTSELFNSFTEPKYYFIQTSNIFGVNGQPMLTGTDDIIGKTTKAFNPILK